MLQETVEQVSRKQFALLVGSESVGISSLTGDFCRKLRPADGPTDRKVPTKTLLKSQNKMKIGPHTPFTTYK